MQKSEDLCGFQSFRACESRRIAGFFKDAIFGLLGPTSALGFPAMEPFHWAYAVHREDACTKKETWLCRKTACLPQAAELLYVGLGQAVMELE